MTCYSDGQDIVPSGTSNTNQQVSFDNTVQISDIVESTKPLGVCEACTTNVRNTNTNGQHQSRQRNYYGPIKPLVSKCCITDPNMIILCSEINSENTESTFSSSSVEEKKSTLKEEEDINRYAAQCVEFLDGLRLDDDELDEEEIEYYDELFEM